METLPLYHWVSVAKKQTARTAEVKDWRLRRKIDRLMMEEARKLNDGKGYIVATVTEILMRYPDALPSGCTDDGRKLVWAFQTSIPDRNGRVTVSIAPFV